MMSFVIKAVVAFMTLPSALAIGNGSCSLGFNADGTTGATVGIQSLPGVSCSHGCGAIASTLNAVKGATNPIEPNCHTSNNIYGNYNLISVFTFRNGAVAPIKQALDSAINDALGVQNVQFNGSECTGV
ncbi:hypothetical protein GGI43DRAFT_430136 [Trichoderma evansii]